MARRSTPPPRTPGTSPTPATPAATTPAIAPQIPQTGPLGTGIATAAAARADAAGVTPFEERGVVGTPIISGFVNELGEYNSRLYGLTAIETYEKMRRGDTQVAATLAAIKLPIRSGDGAIEPAGTTALDKEIAKFVEDNLFHGLEYTGSAGQLVSQSWDEVMKNALLMVDFGCAAHEDVYTIDGDYIRLKKMAPRLPLTFYRFLVEDDGETLIELQQYGYRGNTFMVVGVPAWKLGLFVYDQEGANFYGRSALRAAYKHWYIKEALYKIDAIACERNGLGVPWIGHTSDTAAPLSAEDKETAFKFVTALAAHESSGIYTPPGLQFELVAVKGQVRNVHDSIRHHNEQISKTTLAMFMDQGQAAQGNRALGVSMQDFFFVAAQALADQIARTITHSTIRRLVDFNYPGVTSMTGSRAKSLPSGRAPKASGYPVLRAPQVKYIKLDQVVDALGKLALATIDVVHPDDDLEDWLRREMRLPKAKQPRTRYAPTSIRVQDQTEGGELPGIGGKEPPSPQPVTSQTAAAQAAAAGQQAKKVAASEGASRDVLGIDLTAIGEGFVLAPGVKLAREPRGVELSMALSEITHTLDSHKSKVAAVLRKAKPAVIAEALHKAIAAPIGRAHQVSVPVDPKLVEDLTEALRPTKADGHRQVYAERNKQRAGQPPKNPTTGKILGAEGDEGDDDLKLYAQAAASEFYNNLTQRAVNRAIDFKKNPGDASKGQAIVDAQDEMQDAKDGWIDRVAGEATNEAFNAGRGAAFAALRNEIAKYLYSAILDIHTCGECSAADGKTAANEGQLPDVPNPDCEGGDQCRCVHVAVFGDESPSGA